MKERPILFKQPHADEMVRAILDGRKTQMRRPMKEQPDWRNPVVGCDGVAVGLGGTGPDGGIKSPLGTIGDRLWVRETFGFSRQCDDVNEQERVVVYKACEPFHLTDAGVDRLKRCNSGCLMQPNHYVGTPSLWTPSIHMPRWASRIDLEITRVWVERVQDITEEDAKREGCRLWGKFSDPYLWYRDLWQSIYGTWDANPWVWAYEFRRVKP